MENKSEERVSLAKTLGRGEIWALAFGSIVGWGWVMLTGTWVASAGTVGAIIAFVIAAIFCGIIGMTYAELTPMLPFAGGELVFAYRAGGYGFGWFTAWAMCFAYVAVAAWEGPAFATAINYLIPFPDTTVLWTIQGYEVQPIWLGVAVLGTLFTVGCHYFGMKVTAIFNTIAAIVLAIGGIVFFLGGVTAGDIANAVPAFNNGTSGIVVVLMMAPAMFVGFDVIPQAVEEMKIPLKQVGKMVIFAIMLGALWYILMILGVSFGAPESVREAGEVPVADVAAYVFGSKVFGSLIIVAGLGGILTSWNAMYLGATRIIFAMARAKMLPPVFGKLHPKFKSPTAAILLTGALGLLGATLGKEALGWFVDASSFGVVVGYLCVAISFCILRKKEPNLERPFKAAGGMFTGVLAVIAAIVFISLYLPIGAGSLGFPHWCMVGLWTVIGIILAVAVRFGEYSKITKEEREYLLYGEDYARKNVGENKIG